MKTFDEAISLLAADTQAQHQAAQDRCERFAEVALEAATHPGTMCLVMAMIQHSPEEGQTPEQHMISTLITAFINGVTVGIEMERSDDAQSIR